MTSRSANLYRPGAVHNQTRVQKKMESTHSAMSGFSIVLVALLIAALLHTWMSVQVVNVGYEINQAIKKRNLLTQKNKELAFQVARLKSLKRIEKIAKSKLKMSMPGAGQLILLSELPKRSSKVFASMPVQKTQVEALTETREITDASVTLKSKVPRHKKRVARKNYKVSKNKK